MKETDQSMNALRAAPLEKLPWKVNIRDLQRELKAVLGSLQPRRTVDGEGPDEQQRSWGGWAVTSSTGSYRDGWVSNERCYEDGVLNVRRYKKAGLRPDYFYDLPTEVCRGAFQRLVQEIEDRGFHPRRVRVAYLRAQKGIPWHRDDYVTLEAQWRLLIPLLDSEESVFEWRDGDGEHSARLAADGSVYVSPPLECEHRVFNHSRERTRYQIIVSVWRTEEEWRSYEELCRGFMRTHHLTDMCVTLDEARARARRQGALLGVVFAERGDLAGVKEALGAARLAGRFRWVFWRTRDRNGRPTAEAAACGARRSPTIALLDPAVEAPLAAVERLGDLDRALRRAVEAAGA
jgi:hypothetical protein